MLTLSSTIRRTDSPDGAVLLDIEQGFIFSLNPVGRKVLDLIEAGCREQEIPSRICETYRAESDAVRTDVQQFIEALRQHGILRPNEKATPGA